MIALRRRRRGGIRVPALVASTIGGVGCRCGHVGITRGIVSTIHRPRSIFLAPVGRADDVRIVGRRRIGIAGLTTSAGRGIGRSPISLVRRTARRDGGSGERLGRGIHPIRRPARAARPIHRVVGG
ncbi:MAG TPA: hypothetical protein VGB15_03815, partial [Longimicrobium sp.]